MKQITGTILSLAFLAAAGCGGGPEGGQTVYPVSGTIMMNGAVLSEATVVFSPNGTEPTATGQTDLQGNFQLTTYEFGDGAAAGDYSVIVTKTLAGPASGSSDGGEDAGHEQEADDSAEHSSKPTAENNLVPAKYSSSDSTPLTAKVTADGDNTFNFEITQ